MFELGKKRSSKILKSFALNERAPKNKIEVATVQENLCHKGTPEYWPACRSKIIE